MMAKDQVCGSEVEERKAYYRTEHDGKTYYFCSITCKEAFDAAPEEYMPAAA